MPSKVHRTSSPIRSLHACASLRSTSETWGSACEWRDSSSCSAHFPCPGATRPPHFTANNPPISAAGIALGVVWFLLTGRYLRRRFGVANISAVRRAQLIGSSWLQAAVILLLFVPGFVVSAHFQNSGLITIGAVTLPWVRHALDRTNLILRRILYSAAVTLWFGSLASFYLLHWGWTSHQLRGGTLRIFTLYGVLSLALAAYDYWLLNRLTLRSPEGPRA